MMFLWTWFIQYTPGTEIDVARSDAMGLIELSKIDTEVVSMYVSDRDVALIRRQNRDTGENVVLMDRRIGGLFSEWLGPALGAPPETATVPAIGGPTSTGVVPVITPPPVGEPAAVPAPSPPIVAQPAPSVTSEWSGAKIAVAAAALLGVAWVAGAFR